MKENISFKWKNNKLFEISGAVEKPLPQKAPSSKAIFGRYIFNYSIVKFLENLDYSNDNTGETNLVDCFDKYLKEKLNMRNRKIYFDN